MRWTSPLTSSRAQALNHFTVSSFFEILSHSLKTFNIFASNLYNMNEKGVQMSIGGRARVLVDRNQKTVHMNQDDNKELITIVECICANGSALKPLVIMKGMRTCPS